MLMADRLLGGKARLRQQPNFVRAGRAAIVQQLISRAHGDAVADLDRAGLKAYIKEKELEVRVTKSMSDDDIREKIREACKGKTGEDLRACVRENRK